MKYAIPVSCTEKVWNEYTVTIEASSKEEAIRILNDDPCHTSDAGSLQQVDSETIDWGINPDKEIQGIE